ncbi:SWI/SNF-related matrix-associated actin-dependent regulator of chromatin subfamily D [Enteropsectra breve]|nr:SWI/SNF-related matrix-associated actin-dependent regulator of chromatin subfamily D [Enteropsectra breve]
MKQKLEEIGKRLDAIALEKRLDIESQHMKRIKCKRILRLFVSNTNTSIKIGTKILDEFGNETKTNIWDLVKRVAVIVNANDEDGKQLSNDFGIRDNAADGNYSKSDINREDHMMEIGEDNSIDNNKEGNDEKLGKAQIHEWTADSDAQGFIAFKNTGSKNAQILIKVANKRKVYKLGEKLKMLLNIECDTKQNIIKEIYKYINNNKLNDYLSGNVTCNSELKNVFSVDQFNFNSVGFMLCEHLEPLGYVTVDVEHIGDEIWDIETECDDLGEFPVLYPKIVKEFDKKLEATRITSQRVAKQIETLEEFIADPVYYINRKIALDSEAMGIHTSFYDNVDVQSTVFDLLKIHYGNNENPS